DRGELALWKVAGRSPVHRRGQAGGSARCGARRRNLSGLGTEGARNGKSAAARRFRWHPRGFMAETEESATPAAESSAAPAPLKPTPLHGAHVALGARMVPFAGYEMPVQYPMGVLGEHVQTRSSAGLFDVSHMGQAFLMGPDHETAAKALEALVPADIVNLAPGRQRYSQLLNDEGGILDDFMVTRSAAPAENGVLILDFN